MDFQHEANRIFLLDEKKEKIAEITFPAEDENTVNINHTYVDNSLRGQGVAAKLVREAAKQLRRENKKAVVTCSYAKLWFQENEDYHDILE